MLFDTHCHLTHARYEEDLGDVLRRARAAGVDRILAVASDLDDASAVRGLLDREVAEAEEPRIFGTAGVHPHHAGEAPKDLRARLEDALTVHPAVVGVGECGLDFHYDFSPRPAQRRVFDIHLEVAAGTGLPVVVHCRDAEEEMAEIVRKAGAAGVRGVLHCFPGDLALLDAAMEAGWLVSFTGLVTFRSFEGLDAVRRVPSDRYMLETDGPYMAPVPDRGKRNEPAFVPHIRDRVAELRGVGPEVVERETTSTALAFLGGDRKGTAPGP